MKRLVAAFIILLTFTPPVGASDFIAVATPPHRISSNIYESNQLAESISPEGEFGLAFFRGLRSVDSVYIDVAVLEEIADLVDGYEYLNQDGELVEVAESQEAARWLSALKLMVLNKQIFALPYGNPDQKYLEKRAPAEYRFYLKQGQIRLSAFFGKEVKSADSSVHETGATRIARSFHSSYRPILRNIYSVVPAPEVTQLRLDLGKLLNPELSNNSTDQMIESLRKQIDKSASNVRVTSGSYTITSSQYDLPITIINDFSVPVSLKLRANPSNSRVIVGELRQVSIPANSQMQVRLPIEVIASGETDLMVQIRSLNGRSIGEVARIPLRLAVISPLTTWFTTGMAIILLMAAVVQSMRRVKKRGRNE